MPAFSSFARLSLPFLLLFTLQNSALASEEESGQAEARNVILIIGDGMGDHQITIARNYLVGARGRLSFDNLPRRGAVQVLTVDDSPPHRPVYVADSANSATALATGVVTARGRIATTAGDDKDLPTIIDLAAKAGMSTGIVTTASVTDATPAAFYAHVNQRSCENPSLMKEALIYDRVRVDCSQDLISNGGLGSIAEQLLSSNVDLALGGGSSHFSMNTERGDETLLARAASAGFQVLESKEHLRSAPTNKKLLGLFAAKELPVTLRGEGGRSAESPEASLMNYVHWAMGEVSLPEPMSCEPEPEFGETPSLKLMTDVALQHLSAQSEKGFFLMVESASIDKQSHLRKACGSIGEVQQLNEALDSALAFAERHPSTLILVTADHGQAAQLVPNESLFDAFDLPIYSPGKLSRIITPEKSLMAINYATNEFMLEEHTGVNVPVFTNDEGADILPAMITQPELYTLMLKYLGLGHQ